MMEDAEESSDLSDVGRAALYRDGLVLVFLGYHPLRLRNLRSLRLGHHLIALGHTFLLKIDASETKARRPIEQEVAPRLRDALKRYIGRYRPVLLRARGRWHAPATDEL